jgi:anthranilate/para-aminobenzoate synthase component I
MLSYDFVHYLEKLPVNAADDLQVPDLHFFMIDRLIAFDHKTKKSWIIVCPGARETVLGYSEVTKPKDVLVAGAETVMEDILRRINLNAGAGARSDNNSHRVNISYEMEKSVYDMVTKAKEYIAAGDIFQANLSLRLSAEIGETDPWKVYTILRKINPSPFASFVDFGDYHIVSSSPERLVRVAGRIVDTRPIAGTRPRGKDPDEDETMSAELLLNEKERPSIMLID